jgi:xanthine dehydrogenase molybdopterin-binding subunit B
MQVEIPLRYKHIFEKIPPLWRRFEYRGGKVVVHLALGFEVERDAVGLNSIEFRKLFDSIRVQEGRKILKGGRIVLEPTKNDRIDLRIPRTAKKILERAAEIRGKKLSQYILETSLSRAVQELESQKEVR